MFAVDRGYLAIKREGTYNSDPALSIPGDLLYVEDWTASPQVKYLVRNGMSKERGGLKGNAGRQENGFSFSFELTPTTNPSAGSSIQEDPALGLIGFDAGTASGDGASTPYEVTYELKSANHGSAWIDAYIPLDDDSDVYHLELGGCRATASLELQGADVWKASANGDAASHTHSMTGAAPDANVDYTLPDGAIGGTSTCTITEARIGGSGDSYATDHQVIMCKLDLGMNVQAVDGLGGRRVDLRPGASKAKAQLVLEADDLGTFNPFSYKASNTGISVVIKSNATSGENYIKVSFVGFITNVQWTKGASGVWQWTLDLDLGYPQDGTDGGGLKPDTVLTLVYGTNL